MRQYNIGFCVSGWMDGEMKNVCAFHIKIMFSLFLSHSCRFKFVCSFCRVKLYTIVVLVVAATDVQVLPEHTRRRKCLENQHKASKIFKVETKEKEFWRKNLKENQEKEMWKEISHHEMNRWSSLMKNPLCFWKIKASIQLLMVGNITQFTFH